MSLTPEKTRELINMIKNLRDDEMACDECLRELAEFVDTQLAGQSTTKIQERVERHLADCVHCREEYEALRKAVESLRESD